MKNLTIMAVAASALFIAASCGNAEKVQTEAQLPSKAETDSVSYLVGIQFGYFIKSNNFGEDLNYAKVKEGMLDFIAAEGVPQDEGFNDQFKISPELMNTMFNNFISKRNAYAAEVNLKKGEEFLAKNKMEDGIVVTDSGLQYRIIEEGNDVKPSATDTVWVHYTGTLIDGTEFDKSDYEKDPVRMLLNRVVPGWTEGLQLIGEGGHIQLYIPAELGYGARQRGPLLGPNSTLIFDINLEKVGKVQEAPEK